MKFDDSSKSCLPLFSKHYSFAVFLRRSHNFIVLHQMDAIGMLWLNWFAACAVYCSAHFVSVNKQFIKCVERFEDSFERKEKKCGARDVQRNANSIQDIAVNWRGNLLSFAPKEIKSSEVKFLSTRWKWNWRCSKQQASLCRLKYAKRIRINSVDRIKLNSHETNKKNNCQNTLNYLYAFFAGKKIKQTWHQFIFQFFPMRNCLTRWYPFANYQ